MKKSEKLFDAIGQIDDKYIEEAAHAHRGARLVRWQGALAACAALLLCIGLYALLQADGLLLSPFGEKAEAPAEAALQDEAVPQAEALFMAESVPAEEAAEEAAEEMPAEAAAEGSAQDGLAQDVSVQKRSVSGGVSAEPLQVTVLAASRQSVTFRLENLTESSTVSYGADWYLEQQAEGAWVSVRTEQEIGWDDVLYELPAGETKEETIEIGSIFANLNPGQYRIVKHCQVDAQEQPLYIEFEITN